MSRSRSRSRSRSYSPSRPQSKENGDAKTEHKEAAETSNVIAIFNLSLKTTQDDLNRIFGKYGVIENCRLVMDQKRNKSRGFAFITYQLESEATEAKTQAHGMTIEEKEIRVDYSITRRAHSPTPGVYLGQKKDKAPKLSPSKREKEISPDRTPVKYPYKGRSRTKSMSPESIAKRTAKVRSGAPESETRDTSRERSTRKRTRSRSRDRKRDRSRRSSRSRSRDRSRKRDRTPPRRRSRDNNRGRYNNKNRRPRSRDRR